MAQLRMLLTSICLWAVRCEAAASPPRCRCLPTEPCWPSPQAWNSLNNSIDGNLAAVRPFAHVCHDPTYNAEQCQLAKAMSNESIWLSANPGAVVNANWASWPRKNETCYVETPRSAPCGQGRISLYSAAVRTARHVQAVVRFARKNNIRLAIKNTGHCYLGRSVAPHSLQIFTHNLKGIDFVDNFKPQGYRNGTGYGSAVTIGAGVQLKELYTALGQRNLTAVIGASHTVGAAGGYIQGGGHSPLGPWKGMAADNALEFTVITAKGDLVVANDFQNPDLFWALRGGGGGTWGVVMSVTIRTFPDPPTAVQSLTISTANSTSFWNFISEFHARLPAINDAGGSGYYFLTGAAPGATSRLIIALFFAGHQNDTIMAKTLDPLIAYANATLGPSSVVSLRIQAPAFKYVIETLLPSDSDTGGTIVRLGSRLISREFLSTRSGAAALTDSFQRFFSPSVGAQAGTTITGHIVAGGQVARNAGLDVAVNPAWRRTVTHLTFGTDWAANATTAEQREKERQITEVLVPLFSRLEKGMGAYLNEADAEEREFQWSFWGENYKRLRRVKEKWDGEGMFITRRGVGSEEWDGDGLCRV